MYPTASSRSDADSDATGFGQALLVAGYSDSESSLPAPVRAGAPVSTGSHRSAKDARQQPREEDKRAIAAPVITSLPTALALPLLIQQFSREAGNHEQSARMQSPLKETNRQEQAAPAGKGGAFPAQAPVDVPDVNAAATEGSAETGKPIVSQTANADFVRETSNSPAPENPPLAPASELAFAARLQPASAASAEPGVAQTPLQREIAASAQPSKNSTDSDMADQTVVQPIAAGAESSLTSYYGHSLANSEMPSPPQAAPSAPSAPSNPVEAKILESPPKPASVPLKDISLQVAQPGDQKVEVRVVQQSGELRVAVRTGDTDLAHGLQQGLSDLVGRLQETGYRAEAWRPGGSAVQSGPVFESRTSPGGSHNGDSQSYSGGSRQQEGERRQSQPQRPAWVEELDNSIASGDQPQGASYGNRS